VPASAFVDAIITLRSLIRTAWTIHRPARRTWWPPICASSYWTSGVGPVVGRGGRPRRMTSEKIIIARQIYDANTYTYTVAQIAKTLGVSRSTIYQHLDHDAA
jgi:transcriptional regulator of acetoin/glycerol metabolism